MSFAEFQIRLFAWSRMQDREWEKVRILAWYSLTGSHQNPKKLPKSITQFMGLNSDKKHGGVSEAQKQRFLDEMAKFIEQTKK